jgi:regulator of replication initiation timing
MAFTLKLDALDNDALRDIIAELQERASSDAWCMSDLTKDNDALADINTRLHAENKSLREENYQLSNSLSNRSKSPRSPGECKAVFEKDHQDSIEYRKNMLAQAVKQTQLLEGLLDWFREP